MKRQGNLATSQLTLESLDMEAFSFRFLKKKLSKSLYVMAGTFNIRGGSGVIVITALLLAFAS
jgi:hypothetical protein